MGPRVRPRHARAGHAVRARGPAPGDLEPRLHAGRALRGAVEGGLRHLRLVAGEEHRHRHGTGPRRAAAPGQEQHVRDRRRLPRDRQGRGAHRQALRRQHSVICWGRRAVSGRGRPRPLLDDADRRRRHARQRRSGLCPAAPAAASGPVHAPARVRRPRPARADADLPRQDGGDLRQPHLRLAAYLEGGLRRGGRVPQDAPGRHPDLRPRRLRREVVRWHVAVGRTGVRAPRHLRLPDRPDPRDGRRAGPPGRRAGLPRPDGRAARARQGRRACQEGLAQRHRRLPRDPRRVRPTSGWPTRPSNRVRGRSPCCVEGVAVRTLARG